MNSPKENLLALENSQPWINSDLRTRRNGYLIVVFMMFVIGGWAAVAPIDSAALAPGVVQVEGKRKQIQHLEGGRVSEILVRSGDRVEAGEPVLRLDATADKAEMQIVEGRLQNTVARIDRLKAERDQKSEIKFSPRLTDAALLDQRAQTAIANERSLFMVRKADLLGEEEVLRSRVKGFEAVMESSRLVVQSLGGEIEDLTDLLAEGYVDKQRLRELERMRSKIIGEIADLEVLIEEAQLKILQVNKRFKTAVVDDLTDSVEELYDLEQQYSAVRDRVQRATIRSPISGFILDLGTNTVGAVIQPGQRLMDVVPQVRELVVDSRISPMDIDRVQIGQSAEVRFAVFKDAYMVSGTLVKLSADRLVDEESGLPYYSAEVKLLEEDLHLLEGMTLIPGMPAEVLIKTGTRTMLGYLVSPMQRITSRALIED